MQCPVIQPGVRRRVVALPGGPQHGAYGGEECRGGWRAGCRGKRQMQQARQLGREDPSQTARALLRQQRILQHPPGMQQAGTGWGRAASPQRGRSTHLVTGRSSCRPSLSCQIKSVAREECSTPRQRSPRRTAASSGMLRRSWLVQAPRGQTCPSAAHAGHQPAP